MKNIKSVKSKLLAVANKASGIIATLALMAVVVDINATCVFLAHQPKLPGSAKKLRKF